MIKVLAKSGKRAEILIYDFIGHGFFSDGVIAKNIHKELKDLGDVQSIDVRINSPGGSVFEGMAIHNLLHAHEAEIHVYVDGHAASIASIIAMAGDTITMPANTLMMIHDPRTFVSGTAKDLDVAADLLRTITDQMAEIYAARSGLDEEDVKAMMDEETWMTGTEAVEKGFADEVTDEQKLAACAGFEKFAFKNAPEGVIQPVSAPAGDRKPQEDTTVKPKGNQDPAGQGAKPTQPDPAAAPATPEPSDDPAAQAAFRAADKARKDEIRTVFGPHAEHHAELLMTCLDDYDCTPEAASRKLLARLGESIDPAGGAISAGEDSKDKFIAGASQSLLVRVGIAKREAGNEYNGQSLADLAATCLKRAGISITGMSRDAVARKVVALSTSDFPNLTADVANKLLRKAYEEFPNTFDRFCDIGEVSDFKSNKRIQLGSFNSLDVIPEGGEYTFGDLSEESASIQAATKGKAIRLTRQMIVNDDLAAFNRIARYLGRAAARTVNADAYGALAGNASDGTALFHANHNNLAGSGSAISVASVSEGKAAMRVQKDIGGRDTLNIVAKTMLVPVALEDVAKTLVASETDPSKSNSKVPNIHRNSLEVVSDPVLDAASAAAWFLAADPMDVPLIEVAFLDGVREPFVDDEVEFLTDCINHKVRLDYGVAAIDFRAGWKNAGP